MREAVCQLLDASERVGVPDDFVRFEDAPESSYSTTCPHGWVTDRYVVIGDPEECESYLPQGVRPPIVVGGNATLVHTLGKRTYVHSATTQSTVLP